MNESYAERGYPGRGYAERGYAADRQGRPEEHHRRRCHTRGCCPPVFFPGGPGPVLLDRRRRTSKVALAAAQCEPNLLSINVGCTTVQMLNSQYKNIADPVAQQVNADVADYTASETHNLTAAETALKAEVTPGERVRHEPGPIPIPALRRPHRHDADPGHASPGQTDRPAGTVILTEPDAAIQRPGRRRRRRRRNRIEAPQQNSRHPRHTK